MKEEMLLIHAFLGCDTVSRIYGIGRDKITKFSKLVNICCDVAPKFYNHLSSKLDIQEAGEKLLLGLYNRVNIGSLNKLIHKVFLEKVARKSVVKSQQLPPTTDTSKCHSFRVFHQTQTWLERYLNHLEWGWIVQNYTMVPMFTNQIPAPSELLTYVRCPCKKHGKTFSFFKKFITSGILFCFKS